MKKILTTLALLVATTVLLAQAPQKFSYQGVIRDAAGNLVRNAPVGVRVSLLKASADGVAVYCETHRQSTNANGLLTLTIGDGTVVGGDIAAIDWADGPYFLKTETDITGGSNYTLVGAQQLLSVPYALYAGNTTNAFSGDYNDLSNKPEIPVVPDKVSAFENDAKYLTKVDLAGQLAEMQKQLDSLKAVAGNGYSIENDGKPCLGIDTVTDIDGNKYPTVQIGKQCWMAENLRTTHSTYRKDGDNYYYGYSIIDHGMGGLGMLSLCPKGWHLPYISEWQELVIYVSDNYGYNNTTVVSKPLASREGWMTSEIDNCPGNNSETNNASGFNGKPVGIMSPESQYSSDYIVEGVGTSANFWSAGTAGDYWSFTINYNESRIYLTLSNNLKPYRPVRCIKD